MAESIEFYMSKKAITFDGCIGCWFKSCFLQLVSGRLCTAETKPGLGGITLREKNFS